MDKAQRAQEVLRELTDKLIEVGVDATSAKKLEIEAGNRRIDRYVVERGDLLLTWDIGLLDGGYEVGLDLRAQSLDSDGDEEEAEFPAMVWLTCFIDNEEPAARACDRIAQGDLGYDKLTPDLLALVQREEWNVEVGESNWRELAELMAQFFLSYQS